ITLPYVELHAKSAFSFLEGASLPEDLAARCAELDQPAIAVTDAHGVFGSPRFHMASKKAGTRALIGAEVETGQQSRLTLLVESRLGYQNLCRLITRTKLLHAGKGKPEHPIASDAEFGRFAPGLICLTGGDEGPLARLFTTHQGPDA